MLVCGYKELVLLSRLPGDVCFRIEVQLVVPLVYEQVYDQSCKSSS